MFESKKLKTLHCVLKEQVQDLYDAEKRLTKALPKMSDAASSRELKNAFDSHLKETENHVRRLEEVARILEIDAGDETCNAMKGLIEEGEKAIKEKGEPELHDLTLITLAQKVEHYEISGYGSARATAQALGLSRVTALLTETIEEEGAADKKLTSIAGQCLEKAARRAA